MRACGSERNSVSFSSSSRRRPLKRRIDLHRAISHYEVNIGSAGGHFPHDDGANPAGKSVTSYADNLN